MVAAQQDSGQETPVHMKCVSGSFQILMASGSRQETYSRIEQPTTDPVKCPSINEQREAVDERDKHDRLATGTTSCSGRGCCLSERHQLSAIAEPEEEKRPYKLSRGCDEMAAQHADVTILHMRFAPGAVDPALLSFGGHGQRVFLFRSQQLEIANEVGESSSIRSSKI